MSITPAPAIPCPPQRLAQASTAVRFAVALIIGIHGWYRLFHGGSLGLGEFIGSKGFPASTALAWGITLLEAFGALLLAYGRGVRPLCLSLAAVYVFGIVLLHWPEGGWFVVGAGRNGSEFSVLLISCLLALAWVGDQPLMRFAGAPSQSASS